MALDGALGLSAVVFVIRPAQHIDLVLGFARLGFRQADMRQFGFGVRHPGHQSVVGVGRQPEQGTADDDAGMIVGHVCKLQTAGHVADGKDAAVGCAQALVDGDAVLVEFDFCRVQVEIAEIGFAPGCDQQVRAFDGL